MLQFQQSDLQDQSANIYNLRINIYVYERTDGT